MDSADPREREPESVKEMFGRVAPAYDKINRAMCFGLDVLWRKRLVKTLLDRAKSRGTFLDAACGSGDVAVEMAKAVPTAKIVCTDFCAPMLETASRKFAEKSLRAEFVEADCRALPFATNSFDGATIAFGFRNFQDRPKCLREIARTLKSGAPLCVLEVARAPKTLALPQRLFMTKFVPFVGALFGGTRTDYAYLGETTMCYPPRAEVENMFLKAGFENAETHTMGFGLVAITSASKK